MKTMLKNFLKKSCFVDLLVLLIITVPSFVRLFNAGYFPMHDDQHIVRLFLFDQGVRQGQLYPRWVDGLGFGYGYPLFNFYPPFIYFVGFVYHAIGFSYIWSVKLVFVTGFVAAAIGMYLLSKSIFGRLAGLLSATLYTYFFYHAVLAYVRGALAEFMALAVLPFIFHSLVMLSQKVNYKHIVYFAVSLAILVLTQPLIALPAVFYIGIFILFLMWRSQKRVLFFIGSVIGGITGLGLSIFFWLPSLTEKKFTLVDSILTKELANYTRHYIVPSQFIYSPWGYGGSGEGVADGMTFQLGKVHLFLVGLSLLLFIISLFIGKKDKIKTYYVFGMLFFAFSVLMTTSLSAVVWDNVSALWYLQFPWRYLTFVALFISLLGGSTLYFIRNQLKTKFLAIFTGLIIIGTVLLYQRYFTPQYFYATNDTQKTSFEEVAWRVSSTSYEFVPNGVRTKLQDNHTVLDISHNQITEDSFNVVSGNALVQQLDNRFHRQEFYVSTESPVVFQLNAYYFPGWKAFIERNNQLEELQINDNNQLKLITVDVPAGENRLLFQFEDTPVRKLGNWVSIGSFFLVCLSYIYLNLYKKEKSLDLD